MAPGWPLTLSLSTVLPSLTRTVSVPVKCRARKRWPWKAHAEAARERARGEVGAGRGQCGGSGRVGGGVAACQHEPLRVVAQRRDGRGGAGERVDGVEARGGVGLDGGHELLVERAVGHRAGVAVLVVETEACLAYGAESALLGVVAPGGGVYSPMM